MSTKGRSSFNVASKAVQSSSSESRSSEGTIKTVETPDLLSEVRSRSICSDVTIRDVIVLDLCPVVYLDLIESGPNVCLTLHQISSCHWQKFTI